MDTREGVKLLDWDGDDLLDWKSDAACRGMPIRIFFARQGSAEERLAKEMCATCPVRDDCADYNAVFEDIVGWRAGVYGGTTQWERNDRAPLKTAHRLVTEEDP